MVPLRGVLTALFLAIAAPAQTCEPSPEIARAIKSLPDTSDYRISYDQRMRPLRDLVAKYPRDVFIGHRYQEMLRHRLHLYRDLDRAFELYRSQPADPFFRYLEARLTGAFNPAKAGQLLTALLRDHPTFPWPHLAIAGLTDNHGARDVKKAEPHLRAFLSACPASIEGLTMLRTVDDPEMIAAGARKLREVLEARADPGSVPSWRYLWDLEFRAAPKADQEAVRQRVVNDVESLQKRPHAPTREWYWLFSYAAELTKEPNVRTWMESTVLKQFPDSAIAATVERARWSREHPRPARGATPDQYQAYAALEKARLEELHSLYPNDHDVILDRWFQISSGGASIPLDVRLAIADDYAALVRRSPDGFSSTPPAAINLASLYVTWRVRLDQVPALIITGLRDAELERRYQVERFDMAALTEWRAQTTLADLYLYQKKPDRVRDAIQIGLASLGRMAENPQLSAQDKQSLPYRRRDWLLREGRLAVLEGDSQKALSLFRQYTTASGKDVPVEVLSEVKQLYLDNGGSQELWLDWAASEPKLEAITTASAQVQYTTPLADFQAKDLTGRVWRVADLKGKATFIDVWASWCGPCRAQHPSLQALYNKIKSRNDIQVLTVSVDETAFLAESYLKEFKYTFPAIVSKDLLNGAIPPGGLPQGWIVDAQGRRSEPLDLYLDPDRIIAELEKAAARRSSPK